MFENKPSETTSHLSEKGVWRNVTMVTKFLDHHNTELKQRRRRRQGEGQETHFSVHFLAVVARLRHETSQSNGPAWWTQYTIFLFFFLNLDTVLSDSTPEKIANIWQVEWNWIRSMKFEKLRIHFKIKWIFGSLSSRNFATMVTWRKDFSSLSQKKRKKKN